MLVLVLASVPLLAGVHHLPAGLPIAYSLKYLLSVIKTRRQDTTCVLKAALSKLDPGSLLHGCQHWHHLW